MKPFANECYELVLAFFQGDRPKTDAWMAVRNPLLGNVTPTDMLLLGRGEKLLRWIKAQLWENER